MSSTYDVIVLGAGVSGATAAALLAADGWSVAVIEKDAFPRRKVCGECIAAPNLDLIVALGLAQEFDAAAGPPLERIALYSAGETIEAPFPALRGGAAPWGRALGRDRLDALLLERAAVLGAHVWQPWRVLSVARRADRHTCTIRAAAAPRTTEELGAPVVIDARGSWQRPPEAPSGVTHGRELVAFKASFAESPLGPGVLPVLAFGGGYGGLAVTDGGRLTLACCVRRERLRAWRARRPGERAGDAVQALLETSCAGVRDALRGARRIGPWLAAAPIRPGSRALWTPENGFVVGNAAGEAHPILGEGISMAMQGAWLLCAHLTAQRAALLGGTDQAPLAAAYARDWRKAFAARMRWAALFAGLAMQPHAVRALRPIFRRQPGMLTLGALAGGKTRRLAAARVLT